MRSTLALRGHVLARTLRKRIESCPRSRAAEIVFAKEGHVDKDDVPLVERLPDVQVTPTGAPAT